MIAHPLYPKRKSQMLDGVWSSKFLGESVNLDAVQTDAIPCDKKSVVPGCFDTVPGHLGKRGTFLYKRKIHSTSGRKSILKFHGLGMWSRIYVDNHVLFEGAYPYSGFTVEVPPSGSVERELAILVDNRFDFTRTPLQEQFFDFHAYGGIFRSVEWSEIPNTYIKRVQVIPLSPSEVQIRADIGGLEKEESGIVGSVRFDGGEFLTVNLLRNKRGYYCADLEVPNPQPWTLESPSLHNLTLEYEEDSVVERFGLRTVSTEGNQILLNGSPIKLLGYCRHEAHPQYGPALPHIQLLQDVQTLKDLGCNFVRGSHYPQDQRFLDLCDELGLLVFEESLGWGQGEKQFTDGNFCRQQIKQTELMVYNSINHPSVIIWGYLNEGTSNKEYAGQLYGELLRAVKNEDQSRLVTYATMFPFDDLFLNDVDLISVNKYPGWYSHDSGEQEVLRPLHEIPLLLDRIQESFRMRGFADKPVIISEMGAGALYGFRDGLRAHWSEEYQADYLELLCKEIVNRNNYAGLSIWQFCDCRTYASSHALMRPRGFNNKGTLDEYRRPKLAYEVVKSIFTAHSRIKNP